MTKTVAVLGSTGSIGRQTLEVAGELGLRVAALTANTQVDLLEQQARQYMPRLAVLYDENAALALKNGVVPPTAGLEQQDESCDLDCTPINSKEADLTVALSSSLGFGGHNACIALRAYKG